MINDMSKMEAKKWDTRIIVICVNLHIRLSVNTAPNNAIKKEQE